MSTNEGSGEALRAKIKGANREVSEEKDTVVAVWLVEDGVNQVCLFRAPIWCPSEDNGTREAGGTVAVSLVKRRSTRKRITSSTDGRVSTRFGEGGGQLDCPRMRGVVKHCVQKSKAPTVRFLRRKMISDHG